MAGLQARLYAGNQWSLLLVFQAMDAAGKDGTIRQVMSGVNPQGCQVFSFKAPSSEELDHDFLWRCARALPERGRIGIFNRSYYEEVLVVRVHAELLGRERLPDSLVTDAVWAERYDSMRDFERHLARNGTVVRKFFLNVSKEEQRRRFLSRLEEPDKHWKFNAADVAEREHWDRYMAAYQETIRATATPESPWIVVPADHKWFTRLIVARAIVETLESLDLRYPEASAEHRATLDNSSGYEIRRQGRGAERGRAALLDSLVRSRAVEVRAILCEYALQMAPAEKKDVVEVFSAQRSDEALDVGGRLGRSPGARRGRRPPARRSRRRTAMFRRRRRTRRGRPAPPRGRLSIARSAARTRARYATSPGLVSRW